MNIAFLGNPDIDTCYTCEQIPKLGDKAIVRFSNYQVGGMVANSAKIAAQLKAHCALVYSLSSTEHSTSLILETLRKFSINVDNISLSTHQNKKCIVIKSRGEKIVYVIHEPEFGIHLSESQIKFLISNDLVYTTLSDIKSIQNSIDVCRAVQQSDTQFFIDCDNLVSIDWLDYLKYADFVSINEYGVQKLLQNSRLTVENLLTSYHLEYLLVTYSENGSKLYSMDGQIEQPAHKANVVDTTGAGDTMNIIFVYYIISGFLPAAALELASAGAAYAVEQEGTDFKIDFRRLQHKLGSVDSL